jgi:hypothetical protein
LEHFQVFHSRLTLDVEVHAEHGHALNLQVIVHKAAAGHHQLTSLDPDLVGRRLVVGVLQYQAVQVRLLAHLQHAKCIGVR